MEDEQKILKKNSATEVDLQQQNWNRQKDQVGK